MTLPKAVLFDHDGVLVASEPLHWAAWEALFSEIDLIQYLDAVVSRDDARPAKADSTPRLCGAASLGLAPGPGSRVDGQGSGRRGADEFRPA